MIAAGQQIVKLIISVIISRHGDGVAFAVLRDDARADDQAVELIRDCALN